MFKKLALILTLALLCNTALAQNSYHEVQIVDETGRKVTTITSVYIYVPGTTTDAVIYSDRGRQNTITIPMTTTSDNTTLVDGLISWYGPDGYNFRITDGTNIATNAGHRLRTSSEGRLYFPSYLTNISSADYEDGESVSYGSDDDFIVNAGATANRLTFTPIANNSAIWIGTTGVVSDMLWWGDTPGLDLMWDASDNRLEFKDDAVLSIGEGSDWVISHSGGTTTATGALTHASAQIFSTDATLTGNAYNVEWDNSSDTLHFLDNAELGLGGATTADGDVVFKHDGTDFTLTTIRVSEPWDIGGTTNGFDITYFYETAGTIFTDFTGDFRSYSDDMELRFGTGAGTLDGDLKISSNVSNVLQFEQVILDTGTITYGEDGRDIPIIWYAETSGAEITTTGDTRVYDGVDVTFNDDDFLNFGDSAEISMSYDEDGDDNLQIKGPVDFETTYCQFEDEPFFGKWGTNATPVWGGACTGTTGDENVMVFPSASFIYHILGTQTELGPQMRAGGFDISMDNTSDDGIEITPNILGKAATGGSRQAFTANTDAFYLKVKIYVSTVAGTDDLCVGFRKVEAFNAAVNSYTDYAMLQLNVGNIFIESGINSGGAASNDTTDDWADATAVTLGVFVTSAGVVTYTINGSPPSSTQTYTFDSGDVVVPFLFFLQSGTPAELVYLQSWECGLQ